MFTESDIVRLGRHEYASDRIRQLTPQIIQEPIGRIDGSVHRYTGATGQEIGHHCTFFYLMFG